MVLSSDRAFPLRSVAPVKLRVYETGARYLLGVIYLFGAVDGGLEIFAHVYIVRNATECSFFGVLQHTLYFWGLLKLCELLGAISLLLNYKPVLGLAVVTPISAVLCLFYAFDIHWYPAMVLCGGCTAVLLWAYRRSFQGLLDPYR